MTEAMVRPTSDPGSVALAVDALRDGQVVALPTDTVYGLAVDPSVPGAVERLFALKARPRDVPLPVLVGSRQQVDAVASPLGRAAGLLADRYWPGPLTLVVPRAPGFTADLGGPRPSRTTVGVRWPDHPLVGELCRTQGPLAVTSANPHGASPATRADEVATALAGRPELALILDGGVCGGTPSTVIECHGSGSRCLRVGAIPWTDMGSPPPG
jgi:L-threonylcarbamoyladenylate synthase